MAARWVVVTGADGMLGSALLNTAPDGLAVTGVDLAEGDITDLAGARQAVGSVRPEVVIHCAAYTDVDGCTRDPERAMLVNATGAANVAAVCAEFGAYLIILSTDYVFDGTKGAPYLEEDAPNPLNPYGASKLEGERLALAANEHTAIVRTQWLFGPNGRNFVDTIVRKGKERGELQVVADEFGSPTYTSDLARRLWELVALQPRGIIHCTNSGICTWADLARAALDSAVEREVVVRGISWRDWESPTQRPHYSALDSSRRAELGLSPLRHWTEALRQYVTTCLKG